MVQSLIPVPHPALGARAGSQVARKRSAVGAHACCRRAYRRERPTPRDFGRGSGLRQRGGWRFEHPHVRVPYSLGPSSPGAPKLCGRPWV